MVSRRFFVLWFPMFSVLALLFSTFVAAAQPEDSRAGDPISILSQESYVVSFVKETRVIKLNGHLNGGESRDVPFRIDENNVTRVDFLLTWGETDDELGVTALDTFRLQPVMADGRMMEARESHDGLIFRNSPTMSRVPDDFETDSEGAAFEAELKARSSTVGSGTWKARLTLVATGSSDNTVDKGNDWSLTVTVHHYRASVMRSVHLSGPAGAVDPGFPWPLASMGLLVTFLSVGTVSRLRSRK
ncbi:MAG: hypothetical protein HY556_08520 [Euryarchaeota archaeon]|nr:hypothetical protein [Euryarchaeota archaeon]